MDWLTIPLFLVNEILAVPAFLIGIITAVGLGAMGVPSVRLSVEQSKQRWAFCSLVRVPRWSLPPWSHWVR